MTKAIVASILVATALLAGSHVEAADRGTPEEAKAMLAKAVAHYHEAGRKQALADFTARKPPFADRDLYVVCLGSDHVILAHGASPQFVGASSDRLKDASGKLLGQALWDAASDKGEGAVRYQWLNPVSGQIEPKVSFVQKAGNDLCLVGAYNPEAS
jgi:signal transduction histidine kinase